MLGSETLAGINIDCNRTVRNHYTNKSDDGGTSLVHFVAFEIVVVQSIESLLYSILEICFLCLSKLLLSLKRLANATTPAANRDQS